MENLISWVVKVLENKVFLGWKFLIFSSGKVSKSSLWFLTSSPSLTSDLVFCHLFQTKLAYCYNSLDISASPRTWGRKNNLEGISGMTRDCLFFFCFLSDWIPLMKTSGDLLFFLVFSFGFFSTFGGPENFSFRLGLCSLKFRTRFLLFLASIECFFDLKFSILCTRKIKTGPMYYFNLIICWQMASSLLSFL